MRRRYPTDPEPRADGFVTGGLLLVILLTIGAFASFEAFETTFGEPAARAYTLSQMPRSRLDDISTASLEETAAVPAPISVPETEAPACNVAKCAAAYRSFDVDDCTFQPFDGPRRLCPY